MGGRFGSDGPNEVKVIADAMNLRRHKTISLDVDFDRAAEGRYHG